MARDFFINGETMIFVKGRSDSAIGSLSQFGMCEGPIRLTLDFRYRDMKVDAWGGEIPPETQYMLAQVLVSFDLIHFDRALLDTCWQESMGGAPVIGQMAHAGARMGNNVPRFAPSGTPNPATGIATTGNHFIGLNISSIVGGKPWRFYYTHLMSPPMEFPLGTEKSVVSLQFRAIPYTQDPWNNGAGAFGTPLWDYTLDT